ncbi:MAG: GMC family oxidoreductase N-terminal domain-containing protein [Myxococcales bacterium]|nr:GMC family oxidoreductase N-terminal domain-containing protein [Myxococcales bacterium]
MKRLSSPLTELKESYRVVVVGSGYGGGIAASRLSRAGVEVCLLERGKEWPVGGFPDTEVEALEQMQAETPELHVGKRTGLYDFHVDDEINVFRGCGLGGTSLVNANVSLKADPRVFDDPRWPRALVEDLPTRVEDGYRRASAMLEPVLYPEDHPPLAKLGAQKRSAAAMDQPFERVPINVRFTAGENRAGVEQPACTLCGDCVSGCNVGAKSTTAMNYLPDARKNGARIFCEVEVRSIAKRPDGKYAIHYRPLEHGRDAFDNAPEPTLVADIVVLAAGTLGSTEILLRSRERGLSVSSALGSRFSGNGDVLAFGYNNDHPIHGIGFGTRPPSAQPPVGPCITSAVDTRGGPVLKEGAIVEEGSIPGALAAILPKTFALTSKTFGKDTDHGIADFVRETGRELESLVRGPYHGAVDNTQTYLVMSHDDGNGRMELEGDRLRIRWPGVAEQPVFKRANDLVLQATAANGGTFLPNPLWSNHLKSELITVHPLGGCIMADGADAGVTNHKGQVFSGDAGEEVHDGLYVADGSVIPVPLGVNPLFTISAVAERSIALLAEDHDWTIDYDSAPPAEAPSVAAKPGIRFTERMAGGFSTASLESFESAAAQGERDGSTMSFLLTIATDDLDATLASADRGMTIHGTVTAPSLDPQPMEVAEGRFELLDDDPERVDTKLMRYRMKLISQTGGRTLAFEGHKLIHNDHSFDLWSDTTTLFTTVTDPAQPDGAPVGKGILRIAVSDFARQLTTMEVTGVHDPVERLRTTAKFGRYFAGSLFDIYGGIVAPARSFDADAPPRKRRPLRTAPPELHDFKTSDGVKLGLTRYRGGSKGPVVLSHGLGVSSEIFATDTIETNLVEYLYAHGYDVWLLDYRCSIRLAASSDQSNGDQVADIDYPEAIARVRQLSGAPSVQTVVHCYGSTTFFMSMLAGLEGVRSVVSSQIACHVEASPYNRLKSGLHVPGVLQKLGVESLTAYTDEDADWVNTLYNKALRLEPLEAEERCDSNICHRVSFIYSLLYEHDQLSGLSHDNLHELFGVANISALDHLARMVRAKKIVGYDGEDRYLPHVSRLAVPIRFIHGAENVCYQPRSTEKTYEWLREHNDRGLYSRVVIPNYGHIDCIFGKHAARDVYPHILEHLESTR